MSKDAGEVSLSCRSRLNSTRASRGVVAFLGTNEQPRQAAWRRDFHLNFMPLAVIRKCVRLVADRVLMPQLQGNLLENIVHLRRGTWEESLASGNAGKLVESALAFHPEGAACVAAAQNPDRVERHVRFFQKLSQLVERVAGIVVLAVADQEQRAFRMCAALNFFNAEIAGVVECGLALGFDEGQLIQNRIAVAGFVEQ